MVFIFPWLIISFVVFFLQDFAIAFDENVGVILKNINEKYYHVKRAGLKDLTCTIKSHQLDTFINKDNTYGDVTFYWKLPDKKKVVISCNARSPAPEREKIEKEILLTIGDVIVSRELQEILESARISVEQEDILYKLTAVFHDASEREKLYVIWMDDTYTIQRIKIILNQRQVSYTFTYRKKNNKLLISQIKEQYEKFNRVMHFEYKKVSGYWLVSKMDIFMFDRSGKPSKQPKNAGSIQFSNYKLNSGIDDGLFE
jgi:hypothetical protein